ncbi:hypothetical protein [Roseibium aggregatum]|uniref:hypothetical protein n=1 Tax=Roseibium aggregatum TaxID=187304 RepID=UPI0025AD02C0|nr:hypothetical protein [Roseibium aggregatum]WJS05891.1 hypothetical protein QUB73_29870 [Roseibium aggregatum]
MSDMLFYLEFFDISLRTSVSRAAYRKLHQVPRRRSSSDLVFRNFKRSHGSAHTRDTMKETIPVFDQHQLSNRRQGG